MLMVQDHTLGTTKLIYNESSYGWETKSLAHLINFSPEANFARSKVMKQLLSLMGLEEGKLGISFKCLMRSE